MVVGIEIGIHHRLHHQPGRNVVLVPLISEMVSKEPVKGCLSSALGRAYFEQGSRDTSTGPTYTLEGSAYGFYSVIVIVVTVAVVIVVQNANLHSFRIIVVVVDVVVVVLENDDHGIG